MNNNAAERAICALPLGSKYYLFSGSDAGGERAAVISTIVETCNRAVSTHKQDRQTPPWNWSPLLNHKPT
ncbi:hypothetical protein GOB17_32405 [Sinorhizobium meliloti]|nr:hypothetical protein [Sinorhizobium meliloti]MDX2329776.1 hypothetical protein [Sinorhizobium medicae]MDW9584237.1 hypothetical protein [Sinorhizobium meliloti]MDX0185572.1 hypothetical protein [Sinorhizobium meliloti]MDX0284328.1 hypothetical protein [Sinorhizobium meliloti]RVL22926.1 hypothetical protein CN144_30875 [Sinorhizobium meliloti]